MSKSSEEKLCLVCRKESFIYLTFGWEPESNQDIKSSVLYPKRKISTLFKELFKDKIPIKYFDINYPQDIIKNITITNIYPSNTGAPSI